MSQFKDTITRHVISLMTDIKTYVADTSEDYDSDSALTACESVLTYLHAIKEIEADAERNLVNDQIKKQLEYINTFNLENEE